MFIQVAHSDDNVFVDSVEVFFSEQDKAFFEKSKRVLEKNDFSSVSFILNGGLTLFDGHGDLSDYSVDNCLVVVHNLSSGYKFTLDIMVDECSLKTEFINVE
jgi:hypothetical protein